MTNAQIGQIRDEVAALLTSRLAALPQETAVLQRAARALRQSESIEQWVQIVADAAVGFASRVALFSVEGDRLEPKALRGPGLLSGEAVLLGEAPALRQVIETKETVVCLPAASELGGALFEPVLAKRVHLLPVTGKVRVVGVLYAEGEANLAALETLTALAAGSLELRRATVAMPLIQPALAEPEHRHPVETGGTVPELEMAAGPEGEPVTALAPEQGQPVETGGTVPELEMAAGPEGEPVDWRARRGASAAVARLLLRHAEKLAEGRARKNVYAALRVPIETVRVEYRERFPGQEAYLEAEIAARLLGPAAG
ncbi:MAG: hypothetical protein ACK58M_24905 [Acidobacteriota bacterium]|jgi:hypothetical protein